MRAVVVLPTYNEKENIKILIPKIQEAFRKCKEDMHLLVVDDNSPDGTAKAVKEFQKKYENISLLSGEKKGLGVAYLRGFDHAIKHLKADLLYMMDADLSHPPELIPRLLEQTKKGYDLVIGSRYIPGGDTPDWSAKRKIISRGGNMFARFAAGLYNINDCTSGFRIFRTENYRKINRANLNTRGYAFLTTLLYELKKTGAKIKEIPLVFYDRKYGETKLRTKDMVEFFQNVIMLRLLESRKFLTFVAIGAVCTVVNLGALYVLVDQLSIEKNFISPIIAFEISVLVSFVLNSIYTFKSPIYENTLPKLAKFHITTSIGFVLNILIYNLLLAFARLGLIVGRYDYLLAQMIAILIVVFWNYFASSKWTWKAKI